jgi:hypothetical protein
VSFSPEVEREARPGVMVLGDFGASNSRYADPEADGVIPVFKTIRCQRLIILQHLDSAYTFFEEHLELLIL